jgi:hypothetical protein
MFLSFLALPIKRHCSEPVKSCKWRAVAPQLSQMVALAWGWTGKGGTVKVSHFLSPRLYLQIQSCCRTSGNMLSAMSVTALMPPAANRSPSEPLMGQPAYLAEKPRQ